MGIGWNESYNHEAIQPLRLRADKGIFCCPDVRETDRSWRELDSFLVKRREVLNDWVGLYTFILRMIDSD